MSQNPGVRYGEERWGRSRRLSVVAAVAALAVAGAAVALPLLRDHSQRRLERRAEREVRATAQRARTELLATPTASGPALRQAATRVAGVEVLAVAGDDPGRDDGVRLVFRVRVAKTAASVFGWQQASAAACFAQVVRANAGPAPLERLPCPA
ncbi:hypothetical protein ACFY2R_11280 [Micromonospora olivasterospora]|uniref:Flp pilus-assembly TadE/G-like protein n=1 Tax=Micromonospora olivasterospora TaxID=1880 RepID=A0A562I4U4_MICOL|nr:hypothetical protein [Micromonospora olivasterospora]TWH65826.1 hypothetical protein JD77_00764 [Micromonospora olivasterospora]